MLVYKNEDNPLQIKKKLLDFFVLEVTAHLAADLLGIQPNSAMLFLPQNTRGHQLPFGIGSRCGF